MISPTLILGKHMSYLHKRSSCGGQESAERIALQGLPRAARDSNSPPCGAKSRFCAISASFKRPTRDYQHSRAPLSCILRILVIVAQCRCHYLSVLAAPATPAPTYAVLTSHHDGHAYGDDDDDDDYDNAGAYDDDDYDNEGATI
ncbi:hypothetical protein FHG87_003013 [Trinorchestia longiramus]|nr:hypothetical protein FHG87_003013 [Trinorchestia longiramus]